MAYKFQLGAAKLSGSVQSTGALSGSSVSGSAVADQFAAAVVSQIDNAEIPAAKIAATDSQILVGDGAGKAVSVAMSGDITIDNLGATTIGATKVLAGMLNNNVISAQNEASIADLDNDDEMFVSDGGTLKKVGVDSLRSHYFGQISGDATATGAGALTIANDAVEGTMLSASVADGSTMELSSDSLSVLKVPNAITHGNGIAALSYDGSAARTIQLQISGGAGNTALLVDAGGIDLKATIGGQRTFSDTLTMQQSASISGDLTVSGQLVVLGDTFSASVGTLKIEDSLITVADNAIQLDAGQGFEVGNDLASFKVGTAASGQDAFVSSLRLKASHFHGALVGNADSATQLQNAQNIGGVSFNGSAAIVPQTIDIADEESTDAERLVMFADADGAQRPKNDGDFKYNPSTGALSSTKFIGDGSELTGVVAAASQLSVAAKTADYTLDETSETVVLGNANGGEIDFTLPAASGKTGVMFQIKKIDSSSNKVQIKPASGESLEFVNNQILALETQGAAVSVMCDGTAWFIF